MDLYTSVHAGTVLTHDDEDEDEDEGDNDEDEAEEEEEDVPRLVL